MNLKMALCFLDENDKLVIKEDFNVSWDLDKNKDMTRIENVIVMDQVAAMLNNKVQEDTYDCIRRLLDKVKGIENE